MNEGPGMGPRVTRKTQVQQRFSGIVSSRRDKVFGVTELVALGGSCLVLLLVVLSYLYFLVPARSRLATLERDRAQLRSNLQKWESMVSSSHSTEETVKKIATSVERFENAGLVGQDQGRMALYDQLNQLIVKNGLRNTSGPTYTALEPTGTKTAPGKSMATKWQSAYPGIAVAVTVEGSYQSVRHFIRDMENSKQLIIIHQVELQRATENNAAPVAPGETGESGSGTRGSLVSLQLNMATYFRRDTPDAGRAAQD